MLAQRFCNWRAPSAPEKSILCVGLELENIADWPSKCAPHTTPQEQQEAGRYVRIEDAARHLAGRALARRLLLAAFGQNSAAELARSPYGKPFCPGISADFSISHSGSMVWVALCRCASVGIDVERMRPLPDAAELTSQLHPQEQKDLLSLPPGELQAAFYRCWTRKEAVIKAVGMGLSMPLQSFSVHTGPQESGWIASFTANAVHGMAAMLEGGGQWTSRDIRTTDGYQCSVAAHSPCLDVVVHLAC
ncbi:4'-phosphopantetheinyl transferase superfamily protein [Desulfovibrio desulfuricans]|uniref:4'-phosphopantetheinyl transferase family protein n=1 Tax=Desulfovibrio desulfuricans TaxID=876 RepID=UPI0017824978|nr:4'-phosphopantetheinyl transferase superfamily protein [Desulfovibrio desulfuricans]MBD8894421.1 4'-phosphopantetheinyl transferase superfamily protein [Desulfovibrio desulfuricans]